MSLRNKITSPKILIAGLVLSLTLGFFLSFSLANRSSITSKTDNCSDVCVKLLTEGASPDSVAIEVGQFIQFNSEDGNSHNLSLGKGGHDHEHSGDYYSGEFGADEGWRVQFKEEGTYFFHDHLNPNINVLVVVYTPGKTYEL